MEFDTLITYVLLFLFFVLPSILKRRKKKAAQGKEKKSLLPGKLGKTVRDAFREMERQVLEAKKAARQGPGKSGSPEKQEGRESQGGSIWDLLDDRDKDGAGPDEEVPISAAEARSPEADSPRATPDPAPRYRDRPKAAPEKADRAGISSSPLPSPRIQNTPVRAALPAHALQQAVVWSEILGPPKGLQD